MSKPFLPYGRQWVEEDDARRVLEVLHSDLLTTGPAVQEFEAALVARTDVARAIAVSSGTAALHAAYFAAGLQPGDELVTSPLTFLATANAARYLGATVRFVDVEADTGMIDPDAVAAAINDRTRVIVPVDFGGHPADYDRINALAARHGLTVVADAAHSLGATYHGRHVGCLAHLSELSFHPVKAITTAEGGAVLTDDREMAARAERFRNHGMTREPAHLSCDEGPWYYEMHDLGFNYRISDLHCALGIGQLRHLDGFISRRQEIAVAYQAAFAGLDGIRTPRVREGVHSAWHLYVLRVDEPKRRRAFFERLRESGLGVQVHYIPVYWQPYYRALGYETGLCPAAEDFYSRAVSLPIFPRMTDRDIDRVIDAVVDAARDLL